MGQSVGEDFVPEWEEIMRGVRVLNLLCNFKLKYWGTDELLRIMLTYNCWEQGFRCSVCLNVTFSGTNNSWNRLMLSCGPTDPLWTACIWFIPLNGCRCRHNLFKVSISITPLCWFWSMVSFCRCAVYSLKSSTFTSQNVFTDLYFNIILNFSCIFGHFFSLLSGPNLCVNSLKTVGLCS